MDNFILQNSHTVQYNLLKGVTLHSGTPSPSHTQAHRLSVAVLACSYQRLGAEVEGPYNNKLLIEGLQCGEVLAGCPTAERSLQHASQPKH